jgi:integrase
MSRQLRGTGNVWLRGKTYWVQYCHRGKVHRESARSPDRNVALKLRLAECARGHVLGPTAERLTITDLMTGLANAQERKGNRIDSSATRQRLIDHFGAKERALDLTADRIARFAQGRLRAGLTPASVNRDLSCLRAAFNVALKEGRLDRAPSMPRYREDNVRQGFIEPGDFVRLHDALPEYLKDFTRFLYLTGWRKGEAQSLEWRDVDLKERVIRLRPENSKNKRGRTIRLAGESLELVTRAHDRRRLDCRWVFYYVRRSAACPIGDFRKEWRKALRAAGLEDRLIHDLRRSGVRNGVRAGIPEVVMMKISGHTTRSVFDRYNVVNDDDLDAAAQRIDEYVKERGGEAPRVATLKR